MFRGKKMKGGLSIACTEAGKETTATSFNPLTQICQIECEKSKRRKIARQLASHLSIVFYINPDEQALVYTLCGGHVKNNLEAIKRWVETKLNDENSEEHASFWESELTRVLSQTGRAF